MFCPLPLAALYPASVASRLVESGAFRGVELPSLFPSIDVRTHFHAGFRNDPGIAWLNSVLAAVFAPAGR